MDVISNFAARFERTREEELSLEEYLAECKRNPLAYATAAERMLKAIGEPQMVDTRNDPRLSRIFANKVIKIYPAFAEFFGMEDAIEQVVSYFRHAAQGLEEKKQILYLLGPVGGGKSSIAERLKQLMEHVPFYAIKGSPVNESPLGLFDVGEDGPILEKEYGIPQPLPQPHHVAVGGEAAGGVRRRHPQVPRRQALSVGAQADRASARPSRATRTTRTSRRWSARSTSASSRPMRRTTPTRTATPAACAWPTRACSSSSRCSRRRSRCCTRLLTATQEGNFKGTEGFGAIPFDGIILAHSNESEWKTFRNNKNNEAFLDRIYIVKVPYCLRVSEEIKIYEKLLRHSSLAEATCAPGTLKMMAQFAVLTRLKEPENSSLFSKMQVYDGENLKDTDPRAKSYQEYRDYAGVDEGMSGISTRFAYKIISKVFNFDSQEVAANPVHLMYVLEQQIEREQFPQETEQKYVGYIKEQLAPRYAEFIGKEIQTAYLESYSEYGQNIFDRYVTYADYWIQDQEYRDTDTGEVFDRAALNAELEKIEKPAGIANPKDFRNEIVNFVLRARANNQGKNPAWTSYEKLRAVIEKKMFSNTEELLPVISFNAKASADEAKKHEDFVNRMVDKGYTGKQVRLLCEWYLRVRKSS